MTEQPGSHVTGFRYVIHVQEHLDIDWSMWFDGMTITYEAGGATILEGEVADQSALYGLLAKLPSLNLSLISVQRFDPVHNDGAAELEDL
jgi:hypothetical protein